MKRLIIIALLMLFTMSSAFGFSFSMYDHGETPFDHNNNWSPIDYPNGVGHEPSGGEYFDLEGLKVSFTDDFVYVALANSFGYNASSSYYNQNYRLGDLFIGKDGGNKYEFAVDIVNDGTNGLYQVDSWNGLQEVDGSYYNYSTIPALLGAHEMNEGSFLGDVNSNVSFWDDFEKNPLGSGNGDTWVYEFAISRSLLGDFNSLDFHINIGCGNDLMEESFSAIPEPTTIILFGIGMLGSIVSVRRKKALKK